MEKLNTDSDKLRTLAEWFDVRDQSTLYLSDKVDSNSDEVQKDLRRISDKLTKLEKERDGLKEGRDAAINRWGNLHEELQALKDAVKNWFKAGNDFAMDKINEDQYDKTFDNLKSLIK